MNLPLQLTIDTKSNQIKKPHPLSKQCKTIKPAQGLGPTITYTNINGFRNKRM